VDHSKARARRCAIYTRKSSEEGLEQDFNSLQAQREACEAFIKSQASEGWKFIKTAYDDGGMSGGTMADRRYNGCSQISARGSSM
jgi:site-specific DNA recombinase